MWNCLLIQAPGTRPTNGISIEFEIPSKFGMLWFKTCLINHNEILRTHDSYTVVTRANFHSDRWSVLWTRALQILVEFRIRSKCREWDGLLVIHMLLPLNYTRRSSRSSYSESLLTPFSPIGILGSSQQMALSNKSPESVKSVYELKCHFYRIKKFTRVKKQGYRHVVFMLGIPLRY